nr:integrase, catalytic region, zinc finger, CCHC-type, peptidase aspartic, catalytic [Tanacetum cinerariifolium]
GEPDLPVPVLESFHEQTDEELTETDIKWMDEDDQAIQTILLGLPKDVYAVEKKAKLFNEWEKFTSTDGESIESYYHRFMQLMNDLKMNKHFPENIASNLKFLNNLQPEWKRHVTIVRQTKNLHETDFTQIYDFLKMNQEEVNKLRVKHLAKSHDLLKLMTHSQNSSNFPTIHKDQSSSSTHPQQSFPINNKYNPQPSLNQNFMQPPMTSLEDINDPTKAMNAALILFAKAFQLFAPTNNNQRTSSNPCNRQLAQPNAGMQSGGNQNGLVVVLGIANQSGTGNVVAARDEGDLDEIEDVNANCILMANLQQASTSGTQHDRALVYDTDGSAKVQLNDNCYDNEIFNMFTQEEQYTDLLEPIPKPQLVPQNDNHVTSVSLSTVQSGGTVETSFAPNEETHAHQETVYRNLVKQVAQEDKFLDKEVDLEARIKDLENILLKRDQTVQTMHMLNPKPDSFYHPNQKMALGYPNPSYLKKTQLKQQSLYNGNLLLEEHDPPAMYDSVETLELAQGTKFVRDFKSLAKEADESLDKQKFLELEIKRLLKASVSHDIMSIVQNGFVDIPSDLRTELVHTKEKLELCIIKKEKEYAVERLHAQLRDLKGKSSNTPSASNTLNLLNQKLESKIVELEFQVVNYERKISYLKTTYKNLFDSIKSNQKFFRTVRFGNDHITTILGYGDLKWGILPSPKRNTCFIRDLDGVDFLKGNRSSNLYTINLYDMASASPICLMACATPTKSWLWHQRLSHLNFDTINDLAKNDLVSGLPKFKYAKEHLGPSCEQGKSKRASHPPKSLPNSKQRLHLLHMDLCGLMRVASINGKRLKQLLLHVTLKTVPLFTDVSTRQHTSLFKAENQTSLTFMFLELSVIRRMIVKISVNLVQKRMNVTFDELSVMDFEQNSSRPGLQSMNSGQISSELELTYAPSTITPQRPSKRDLDILFEPLHNEFLGGRPTEAPRVIPAAPVLHNLQAPTASKSFQDYAPVPKNYSNTPVTSHNADATSQQHAQQQRNLTPLPTASAADNVSNVRFEGELFVNPFGTPSTESVVSSTQYVDPSNMHTFYQPYPHDYQWTKDHPLEQVIGEPFRPVLTRNQLKTNGDMCIYAFTVSILEPKTVKEALTDLARIESMQE